MLTFLKVQYYFFPYFSKPPPFTSILLALPSNGQFLKGMSTGFFLGVYAALIVTSAICVVLRETQPSANLITALPLLLKLPCH